MIQRACAYLVQVFFTFVAVGASSAFAGEVPFAIDDYFKLSRATELALSSDGEMIAYALESSSLAENKTIRTVFVSATAPGAKPDQIGSIQKAREVAWAPGTHELAYLSNLEGAAQIFSIDTKSKKSRQYTNSDDPVTAFRFAPDGSALAWTTQSNDNSSTLYDRLIRGDEGVVIDPENAFIFEFIGPEWPDVAARPANEFWVKEMSSGEARRVEIPGKVKTFHWGLGAKLLSISYVDDDVPLVAYSETYTSLGVYDVAAGTFRPIAQARAPSKTEDALYYSGGEWIPEKNALIVRRTKWHDWSLQKTEWSIFDLSGDSPASPGASAWRPIDKPGPIFLPVNERLIYSEKTVRARQSLYQITPSGVRQAKILNEIAGGISHVRFNADFSAAAFVNEDLDRPPEIYLWRNGHGVTQLTQLNRAIAAKRSPRVKEVRWRGKDGVSVQGWLLEPADDSDKPWPLITFVHGGPSFAFPNQFAPYFYLFGGTWPYPFDVYALNGMAVFIPNYRGTATFGYDFEHPNALDKEPADDIISGIDHLVAEGIADPERLAISGHSHGGWLAPLVMTKAKYFQAASFAEGTLNKIVNYYMMPNQLNRNVHDIQYGASLYDDPMRYIELSPDLHFKGLNTAVLFEAGAKSLAINMMGAPKAARRAGMPAEFVVYPRTGHGIQIPRLQKESAQTNLDWFRFWLQDYADPAPQKQGQYKRWSAMRDEQCERLNGDVSLSYCRE